GRPRAHHGALRGRGPVEGAGLERGAHPPGDRGLRSGAARGGVAAEPGAGGFMKRSLVLAIDQGTTGTTALLLDAGGQVRGRGAALKGAGFAPEVRRRTGLVLDPYFSSTKLEWLLSRSAGLRARARRGTLGFGTVDSWLLWKLTGGAVHATDPTNASRTLLF